MKLSYLAAASVAAAALHSPALADRPPSAHIRCDGFPDNVTSGETAARLLGAVALVGLFVPPHETVDQSMRRTGEEGIQVCNQALDGESNDLRRAQLILAGAIHRIEAGQFEAAIEQARRVQTDRPALAATTPFRLGLALSALDVEAYALLRLGRTEEALAKAMEMAAAAPYDVNNQITAAYYLSFATAPGPAENAFYENLVRLHPSMLLYRAFFRELHGDLPGALADYDLEIRFLDAQLGGAQPALLARTALSHALAGNFARAEELIGRARGPAAAEGVPGGPAPGAAGKAAPEPSPIAVELIDLYRVWRTARDGDAAAARTLFLARSSWVHADALVRAGIIRLLRQGAAPDQLTGALAQTPEAILADYREQRRTNALAQLSGGKGLFGRLRPSLRQEDFTRFARDAWAMERSRIINFPLSEGADYRSYSATRIGSGTVAGYALLLHAALRARQEGNNAFTLFPGRNDLAALTARSGNRGEEGMFEGLTLDAEQVIADLSPIIPQPAARGRRRR